MSSVSIFHKGQNCIIIMIADKGCFASDAMVSTPNGEAAMENIKIGQKVLTGKFLHILNQ